MLQASCNQCGCTFLHYPKDKGRFCSLACYRVFRSQQKERLHVSRPCVWCGTTIENPQKASKRFCSRECFGQWERSEMQSKPCAFCGKDFAAKPGLLARRKYCSKDCADQDRIGHTFWELPKVNKACLHCGKDFDVIPARKDQQYCSKHCSDTSKKGRFLGEANWNWKPKSELTCEWCGTSFQINASSIYRDGKRRAKYCSRECVGAATTAKQGGRQSGLERRVAELLTARGYDFIPQMKVGRYSVDFGFPDSWHVLELHGDYWHKTDKQKKRDEKKLAYLGAQGYAVIVVWEHQFNAHPEMWTEKILDYVRSEVL